MAGNPLMNMLNGNNPMMNNPLMQMINMMRGSQNPMQILNQVAGQNQGMANVMQLANGKSPEQMSRIIKDTMAQKGISMSDLAQMAQSMGIPPEIATKYGIEISKDQINNA